MFRKRMTPIMLVADKHVVKTKKFSNPIYVGDPINIASIYSEYEVDELIILDILATKKKNFIDFELLRRIAKVSQMPLCYGGGIRTLDDAIRIFDLGFEKISVNNSLFYNLGTIEKIANIYGNQAVLASIDFISRNNRFEIFRYESGEGYHSEFSIRFVNRITNFGVGEIMLNSVDKEGSWEGFPSMICKEILDAVQIPTIAHGGITNIQEAQRVLNEGFQAVGISSSYIFQDKNRGVVIHKFN